jgi:opacity protein-like surface antigen
MSVQKGEVAMNRSASGLFMLLVLLTAPWAQRQALSAPKFFAGVGTAFPSSPVEFKNYWNTGFGVGGGVEFGMAPGAALIGRVEYDNLPFDGEAVLSDLGLSGGGVTADGGAASVLTALVGVRIHAPTGAIRPYGEGAIGFGHFALSDITVSDGITSETVPGASENNLAVSFGGGIRFTAGPLNVFADFHWTSILMEGDQTHIMPLRVGLMFP